MDAHVDLNLDLDLNLNLNLNEWKRDGADDLNSVKGRQITSLYVTPRSLCDPYSTPHNLKSGKKLQLWLPHPSKAHDNVLPSLHL